MNQKLQKDAEDEEIILEMKIRIHKNKEKNNKDKKECCIQLYVG